MQRAGLDPDARTLVDSTTRRLIEEVQAGNEAVIDAMRPHLEAYFPSQLFQAITDGPILLLVLALIWLRPRKPGVVGSWFLISYGVMRIATEVWRQPDAGVVGLPMPWGEVSRGQVLSALMVLAGIVALIICARRAVEPMGGLRTGGAKASPPPPS